ncbi:hypothetical protein OEZ85_012764 [Tetradesmus obliquus]|uniref:Barwin domain-containing protein n=1 Tax=Tetradesmus obliquus TaxID=3088 RepID=A0ABY8U464_TETOB|nr:hypothetical protein OEZ85_012764 [Tetradesmus obliquus]
MANKLFYALLLVFICGGALCQLALAARDFGVADSGNVALTKRSNANYHIYETANFPDGRTQRGSHPGYPNVQNLYCMCPLEGKSSDSEFFKQYGWIAAGPETGIQCGECIKIRNVLNGKTIVARRMDEKGEGGFDFDYERTFKPLDSGDVNFKRGNMDFDWAKVPC